MVLSNFSSLKVSFAAQSCECGAPDPAAAAAARAGPKQLRWHRDTASRNSPETKAGQTDACSGTMAA